MNPHFDRVGETAPTHDPKDPSPWLALYLDSSYPINDEVKRAWLRDASSRSRQYFLPLIRPFATIAIILVQLVKFLLPERFSSSRLLHRILVWGLSTFVTPEANWLILRHFHAGAENLAWLNRNLVAGSLALDSLRPTRIADLADNLFVRHDINLYNFIIGLNLELKANGRRIEYSDKLNFADISERGEFQVRLDDMPRRWSNVLDLQTAITLFTPLYQLLLNDKDFWRATHSLQFDETICTYGATLAGHPEAIGFVNNRHPLIPDVTWFGAWRLMLHGLATEGMHHMLVLEKQAQRVKRAEGSPASSV